jgi:hypothetical protein
MDYRYILNSPTKHLLYIRNHKRNKVETEVLCDWFTIVGKKIMYRSGPQNSLIITYKFLLASIY